MYTVLHVETRPEVVFSYCIQAFKKAVDDKFNEYLSIRGTAKNTGECMTELFDQVRQHRVNMDGDVCTVMVTTLILEVIFVAFFLIFVCRSSVFDALILFSVSYLNRHSPPECHFLIK